MLILWVWVLLCGTAKADKANFVVTTEDSVYHAEHLKRHIGEENCICTGTYVKIRLDAGADSKVVGHLEQADRFLVLNVEGKYAQIQITEAGSSSLDAHNGLKGWINADYIQCACDEQTYYTAEKLDDGQEKAEPILTPQSDTEITQTEAPIRLENDSEANSAKDETGSILTTGKAQTSIQIPKEQAYLWLAGIGILFVLIIAGVKTERRRLFTVRIEKGSKRLKALREINSRYQFDQDVEEQYEHYVSLRTKQQYDQFNFERYMREMMETNFQNHENLIRRIQYNRNRMQWYQSELSALPDYMSGQDARRCEVPYSFCKRVEKKLCEGNVQNAVTSPHFVCIACYTSPQGRNAYRKEADYTYKEFFDLYNATKQEMQWRQTRQGNAEYERSKMNSSIRYDILKRDRFKCVICGRSAKDGVKLHVDHIIPVSKGGKTEYSNLRTLCDACNFGKRDKYDINGWN